MKRQNENDNKSGNSVLKLLVPIILIIGLFVLLGAAVLALLSSGKQVPFHSFALNLTAVFLFVLSP